MWKKNFLFFAFSKRGLTTCVCAMIIFHLNLPANSLLSSLAIGPRWCKASSYLCWTLIRLRGDKMWKNLTEMPSFKMDITFLHHWKRSMASCCLLCCAYMRWLLSSMDFHARRWGDRGLIGLIRVCKKRSFKKAYTHLFSLSICCDANKRNNK